MKKNIDDLLEAGRGSEPADEGFTDAVMRKVRTPSSSSSWRRHVTRPVLVAAAITLLSSAAYATIRTTEERPQPVAPETVVAVKPSPPITLPALPIAPSSPKPSPSDRPSPKSSPTQRPGNYGYTSPHTAYMVDRGLRLETDTATNSFATSTPQDVTLTLENVSSEAITVWGPRGCVLSVSAYKNQERSDSPPVSACAASAQPNDYAKDGTEVVSLRPGEKYQAVASVSLPKAGDWAVMGRCVCSGRDGEPRPYPQRSPDPSRSPSGAAAPSILGSPSPAPSQAPRGSEGWGWRMMTPPIKVTASDA